ncbi:hypothetical protein BS78_K150900 [Paspalum vaginatum]|uniref:Uncharacterized protein n=1 Tax=Paspalum vaginatum TaxID=158149 RepID=A0A9W7X8V8_9POAL|nr:hypothetical protein BS78_K150900 [Paspalum vaginatum]
MASAFAVPFSLLCLAITALELFYFLDQQPGGGRTPTPAQASLLHSAAEVMPPLAALSIAIACMYHRLMSHAAGAGNRRLSGPVFLVLCVSIGALEYILFVRDAGGLAALRALPAAAAGAFFVGMTTLFVVAHVRAGGGGDAVAGDGPVQGPVRLLTKVALEVAAALALLMVVALYGCAK